MECPGWFTVMKRSAVKLPDGGDFNFRRGEFNPEIVRHFVGRYVLHGGVLWEPFAGVSKQVRSLDICDAAGVRLIAYDLSPIDPRVEKYDSTMCGPPEDIDGVIFHPPYYGSAAFSEDERDVAHSTDIEDYRERMRETVELADRAMRSAAVACVVGSAYRLGGELLKVSWLFCELFIDCGFEVVEMLSSVPDVAVVLRREA